MAVINEYRSDSLDAFCNDLNYVQSVQKYLGK